MELAESRKRKIEVLGGGGENINETNKFRFATVSSAMTDKGGMHENQDECFIFNVCQSNVNALIAGVVDGHGKRTGRIIAQCAKAALCAFFEKEENMILLISNPTLCMAGAFTETQQAVLAELDSIEKVIESPIATSASFDLNDPEGATAYLSKPCSEFAHGGAVCTVTALINDKLIVGNIGDVTAVLTTKVFSIKEFNGSSHKINLTRQMCDTVVSFNDNNRENCTSNFITDDTDSLISLLLTAEHSPDNRQEYLRLRSAFPSKLNPNMPALRFSYNQSDAHCKECCELIFDTGSCNQPGNPSGKKATRLVKNVRQDWATFVLAPAAERLARIQAMECKKLEPSVLDKDTKVTLPPSASSVIAAASADHASGAMSNPRELSIQPPLDNAVEALLTLKSDSPPSVCIPDSQHCTHNHSTAYCLSCTRTFGNQPLIEFGISHLPTVSIYNMQELFHLNSSLGSSRIPSRINVLIASDGVWDNWHYKDAVNYIWKCQEIHLLQQFSDYQRRANSQSSMLHNELPSFEYDYEQANKYALYQFMRANKQLAYKNFGADSDNATAVLVCLSRT